VNCDNHWSSLAQPRSRRRCSIYKIGGKGVWLGAVEAPDEGTATEKAAVEIQGAGEATDGDTAMTRRKGTQLYTISLWSIA
jgi:hypothetical protein